MNQDTPFSQTELTREQNIKLLLDFIHRSIMHHAMWLAEVNHQFDRDKAFEILKEVYDKNLSIQMNRYSKVLGFELIDGMPEFLHRLSNNDMESLKEAVAVNWLATDGIWFQAVEFSHGMNDAKRCNDSCWGQFSPLEAWSIKKFLGLADQPGLDGLKKALNFRLYANINRQSFEDVSPNSFIFRMNECRVQNARKRKGLDDYPCKSGGMVEYRSFAEAIDSRIITECLGCPPDPHPEEWYCAWKFSIGEK